MALTVTEAHAVNQLLAWFLALDTGRVDWPPSNGEAREAAELLVEHAHRTLGAGLTCDRVRDAWPLARPEGATR
jgi:hypothetical protein